MCFSVPYSVYVGDVFVCVGEENVTLLIPEKICKHVGRLEFI